MTTKTEENTEKKPEVVLDANSKPVTHKEPEVKVEVKPPPATKSEPGTKVETKTDGGEKKPLKVTNDDEEIPDDAELVELSPRALKSRIGRATKKELKDRFGTDDPDEIKAKLDKWAALEQGEEERKRAALTEKERLEADLKAANERATTAERQARIVAEDRVVDRMDQQIVKVLSKHLDTDDEDAQELLFKKLAKHLAGEYTKEELKALYDGKKMSGKIDKWAEEYAKSHPKYARTATAAPPEKKPLSNTSDNRESATPSGKSGGDLGGKNFSPTGPNAMSPREARAEAAKQGLRW